MDTPEPSLSGKRLITAGPLTIGIEPTRDGCAVRLTGELDSFSAPQLLDELRGVFARDHQIVLDLSELTFLDSSGLRCLVQATQRSEVSPGRLQMIKPRHPVDRVFALTDAGAILPLVDD